MSVSKSTTYEAGIGFALSLLKIYSEIQTGAFWSRFEKLFKSEGESEMKLLKFGRFFLGGLLLLTLLSLGACSVHFGPTK